MAHVRPFCLLGVCMHCRSTIAKVNVPNSLSGPDLQDSSYRFIELPEQEHCLNAFRCTSSDSTTNVTWKQENCVPKSIRDSRVSFVFNLAIVFIIGLIGNILTLAAFPYAWIYYKNSFPGVLAHRHCHHHHYQCHCHHHYHPQDHHFHHLCEGAQLDHCPHPPLGALRPPLLHHWDAQSDVNLHQ